MYTAPEDCAGKLMSHSCFKFCKFQSDISHSLSFVLIDSNCENQIGIGIVNGDCHAVLLSCRCDFSCLPMVVI